MVNPSWAATIEVSPCAIVDFAIAIGVGNLLAIAEDRALTSTDGHLGATIAVEVGYGETR